MPRCALLIAGKLCSICTTRNPRLRKNLRQPSRAAFVRAIAPCREKLGGFRRFCFGGFRRHTPGPPRSPRWTRRRRLAVPKLADRNSKLL